MKKPTPRSTTKNTLNASSLRSVAGGGGFDLTGGADLVIAFPVSTGGLSVSFPTDDPGLTVTIPNAFPLGG